MGDLRIQIECERGVYNPHSHELGPYQVHGGPGKLDVAGEHSSVRNARVFSRFGFFSRQQESGRYIRLITLHPGYALSLQIVSLTVVRQSEIAVVAERAPKPRLSEECGLLPKSLACFLRQPLINLFQMPPPVMAGDALYVDSQENFT